MVDIEVSQNRLNGNTCTFHMSFCFFLFAFHLADMNDCIGVYPQSDRSLSTTFNDLLIEMMHHTVGRPLYVRLKDIDDLVCE